MTDLHFTNDEGTKLLIGEANNLVERTPTRQPMLNEEPAIMPVVIASSMNKYTRSTDGAVMREVAPHCYVNETVRI